MSHMATIEQMNQALALIRKRRGEPEEAVASAPETVQNPPPVDEGVSTPPEQGEFSDAIRAARTRDDILNLQFERVDRLAETNSQGAEERAALHLDLAKRKRETNDLARREAAEQRAFQREAQDAMRSDWRSLRTLDDNPPDSTGLKVAAIALGLAGTLGTGRLSEGGRGIALAGMLDDMSARQAEGWTRKRESLARKIQASGWVYDNSLSAEQNALAAALKMNDLDTQENISLIDAAMERTNSEVAKRNGEATKIALQEKAVERRAAFIAAQKRENQLAILDTLTPEQREALRRSGKITEPMRKRILEIEDREAKDRERLLKEQRDVAEIEKLKADAAAGPKMTEAEMKNHAILKPLSTPERDGPLDRIENLIYDEYGNERKSDEIDVPWYGTNRGLNSWAPDTFVDYETIQFNRDIDTLKMAYVRMRSGAGVKEDEALEEIESMGVYSRDETAAAQGLKQLARSIRAGDVKGTIFRSQKGVGRSTSNEMTRSGDVDDSGTVTGGRPSVVRIR